jgi:hypothetical protein
MNRTLKKAGFCIFFLGLGLAIAYIYTLAKSEPYRNEEDQVPRNNSVLRSINYQDLLIPESSDTRLYDYKKHGKCIPVQKEHHSMILGTIEAPCPEGSKRSGTKCISTKAQNVEYTNPSSQDQNVCSSRSSPFEIRKMMNENDIQGFVNHHETICARDHGGTLAYSSGSVDSDAREMTYTCVPKFFDETVNLQKDANYEAAKNALIDNKSNYCSTWHGGVLKHKEMPQTLAPWIGIINYSCHAKDPAFKETIQTKSQDVEAIAANKANYCSVQYSGELEYSSVKYPSHYKNVHIICNKEGTDHFTERVDVEPSNISALIANKQNHCHVQYGGQFTYTVGAGASSDPSKVSLSWSCKGIPEYPIVPSTVPGECKICHTGFSYDSEKKKCFKCPPGTTKIGDECWNWGMKNGVVLDENQGVMCDPESVQNIGIENTTIVDGRCRMKCPPLTTMVGDKCKPVLVEYNTPYILKKDTDNKEPSTIKVPTFNRGYVYEGNYNPNTDDGLIEDC